MALLKIEVINLLGRYSLMKLNKLLQDLVRSATMTSLNLRLNPPEGEDQPQDLRSDVCVYSRPHPDGSEEPCPMSILNFDNLLGRSFFFL